MVQQYLGEIIADEHAAHQEGREDERVQHSMAFHLCIADHAPNAVLGRMLRELVIRTSIVIALYKAPGMSACYRGDDHQALADALSAGHGEEAARRARDHLDALEARLSLEEQPRSVDLAEILER
ncbi:MAG: FCD domain-containing protein [Arhodomonas sp.]|nr:FCD domain-containing protein [Arhodomonas sp.]